MKRVQSWEVSDEFWEIVEPLIPHRTRDPNRRYQRRPGAGRKPLPARKVFEAIVYVLRTGIQWKALPKEVFGAPSAIHRYFCEWLDAGFFEELWRRGLAEYNDLQEISWEWQSIDGAMMKVPLGREAVGNNPTDRGKKREQATFVGRRAWSPAIAHRNRGRIVTMSESLRQSWMHVSSLLDQMKKSDPICVLIPDTPGSLLNRLFVLMGTFLMSGPAGKKNREKRITHNIVQNAGSLKSVIHGSINSENSLFDMKNPWPVSLPSINSLPLSSQ